MIRQIDCSRDDAQGAVAELRRLLSPSGNVVSPEGRARTIAAFGEPLSPQQVVERICSDVAARGLDAVLDYSRRLDGESLEPGQVRVSRDELGDRPRIGRSGLSRNHRSRPRQHPGLSEGDPPSRYDSQSAKRGSSWACLHRPLRRVGVCIPGGAAAYPSTVLMTVVPAQAAGWPRSPWSCRRPRSAASTPISSPPAMPWA